LATGTLVHPWTAHSATKATAFAEA